MKPGLRGVGGRPARNSCFFTAETWISVRKKNTYLVNQAHGRDFGLCVSELAVILDIPSAPRRAPLQFKFRSYVGTPLKIKNEVDVKNDALRKPHRRPNRAWPEVEQIEQSRQPNYDFSRIPAQTELRRILVGF